MTAQAKKRGRPKGAGKKNGPRPGSRRWLFEKLAIGESAFFTGEQGEPVQTLMASLSATYRGGENMRNQGLEMLSGITILPGEYQRPCIRVMRISEPTNTEKNDEALAEE